MPCPLIALVHGSRNTSEIIRYRIALRTSVANVWHIRQRSMTMRNRCCCNCRHDIRVWEGEHCTNHCEIDGHYIGYIQCFEGRCRHWAKDKWQEEGVEDEL